MRYRRKLSVKFESVFILLKTRLIWLLTALIYALIYLLLLTATLGLRYPGVHFHTHPTPAHVNVSICLGEDIGTHPV